MPNFHTILSNYLSSIDISSTTEIPISLIENISMVLFLYENINQVNLIFEIKNQY
jgi:hypothetical protein